MEKIKKAYYYLFYKLYKHAQKSATIFLHEFIAGLYLEVLIVFILLSVMNYHDYITTNFLDFGSGKGLVLLFILIVTVPNILFSTTK